MSKKILLLVIGIILPAIWPLFHPQFFNMHDYTHVARLYEMDKALKDGHFPVYWAKDLGWGYGMPLFNFYAPLPYYFAEIFHLIGFSFLNAIKICFGATFFIGFMGMYKLAKKFWGPLGGILAGIAFVYSPYRAVDFYVRGALGELFAISLIPLVLWGITEIIDKAKIKNIALHSLLFSFFLLSHTVLNLICFPIFIIFGLFYLIISKSNRISLIRLGCYFLLGLGLASFSIFPAFLEKDFVQLNKLVEGYSNYSHHFLYFRQFFEGRWGYGGSVDGINDGTSFHLGKGHLLLGLITLFLTLIFSLYQKKLTKKKLMVIFFTIFIFILAFLSTYHAKPIWDMIPLMNFIQFPWRLNSAIIVFLSFLTGGVCFYSRKISKKITFIVLLLSCFLILVINLRYFRPQTYVKADDFYYTDEKRIKENMSGIIADYIPIWVKKEPPEIADGEYKIINGDPKIELIENKTNKLELKIISNDDFEIQLNRFYFPGWQIYLNNKNVDFDYKNNNGIINLKVPSGDNDLVLKLELSKIKIWSNFISCLSLLILGGLIVFKKKNI